MSEVFTPKTYVTSGFPLLSESVLLASGQNIVKGTVLGKKLTGAISVAAKTGGNTGEGTVTAISKGKNTKAGVYKIRCVSAATAAGSFTVVGPDGYSYGVVIASAGGTVFANDNVNFTITAAGTDFVVGDGFDITVAAGNGEYSICNSTAVDGTQHPVCVAAEGMDASLAARNVSVYITGVFIDTSLVFGGSDTIAVHKDALRALNIYVQPIMPV